MSWNEIFDKLEGKVESPDDITERIVIFAPTPSIVPEDTPLSFDFFTRGANLRMECGLDEDYVVLLVANDDVDELKALELIASNQDVFNIKAFILKGLPNAEYEHWFNSLFWNAGFVSYRDVISEATVEKEIIIKDMINESTGFDDQMIDSEKRSGHVRGLDSDLGEDINDDLVDGEVGDA